MCLGAVYTDINHANNKDVNKGDSGWWTPYDCIGSLAEHCQLGKKKKLDISRLTISSANHCC